MFAVREPFGLRHTTLVALRPASCTHDGSVADNIGEVDAIGRFCSHGGGSAMGFAVHIFGCGPVAADWAVAAAVAAVAESTAWAGTCAINTREERNAVHHAQRERVREVADTGIPPLSLAKAHAVGQNHMFAVTL